MTKPQIWVAAFLLLFIALFILGRVTQKDESEQDFSTMNSQQMSEQTSEQVTGKNLFNLLAV